MGEGKKEKLADSLLVASEKPSSKEETPGHNEL
jgi:hypothetical protein